MRLIDNSTPRVAAVLLGLALAGVSRPAAAQTCDNNPNVCANRCNQSTPCNTSCVVDACEYHPQWITCGQWGVCQPPPSCNYVPVEGPNDCRVDFDQHVWGTRLELQAETLYQDANGQCPSRWQQEVVNRHDCQFVWGDTGSFQCCLDWLGDLCYYLVPGFCH